MQHSGNELFPAAALVKQAKYINQSTVIACLLMQHSVLKMKWVLQLEAGSS